ncbi:MAG: hypothetical protein WBV31_09015 [Terriglobales bacterium]
MPTAEKANRPDVGSSGLMIRALAAFMAREIQPDYPAQTPYIGS